MKQDILLLTFWPQIGTTALLHNMLTHTLCFCLDRRCGHVENGRVIELACPIGSYISNVAFASYGTPTGTCSDLTVNSSCHVNSSLEIVSDLCVGERECNVAASSEVFGDSCSSENQSLGVRVECTGKIFFAMRT